MDAPDHRDGQGRFVKQGFGGIKVRCVSDLPAEHGCNVCNETKSIELMCVVHHRRTGIYYVRPRCKKCHNNREQGHRREWKRKYLQNWRAKNRQVNESYWRNETARQRVAVYAASRWRDPETHAALLIQGRLKRSGQPILIAEARELCRRYGPCYPTNAGLTAKGLKEVERVRSAFRRTGRKRPLRMIDIRMMVYEDGLFIKPCNQPRFSKNSNGALEAWHERKRKAKEDGIECQKELTTSNASATRNRFAFVPAVPEQATKRSTRWNAAAGRRKETGVVQTAAPN